MSRDITPEHRTDLMAEVSPNAVLVFVEITHPRLTEAVRIVNDPTDFLLGGNLFFGVSDFLVAPVTDDDSPPTTRITIPNLDRRVSEAIRNSEDRAQVALSLYSLADFDLSVIPRTPLPPGPPTRLYGFDFFDLTDVTADALTIEGNLGIRDYTAEPWPSLRATQARCPGLFR